MQSGKENVGKNPLCRHCYEIELFTSRSHLVLRGNGSDFSRESFSFNKLSALLILDPLLVGLVSVSSES